ncbi:hypothetical protein JL720_7068 [Aureococcus anophagefferens]|nr:hypothetical protein JL720_7068 [Aureococcus anophagefferens]
MARFAASVSRELEPVFVTERPWRLRLRVRDLVERYRGRGAAEILERSGVTRLVVIAAGLGDDVATALWKTARRRQGGRRPRTTLVIASPDREAGALSAAFGGFARALADASARPTVVVERAGGGAAAPAVIDGGRGVAAAASRKEARRLAADLAEAKARAAAAEKKVNDYPTARPINPAVLERKRRSDGVITVSISADEAADSATSASDFADDTDDDADPGEAAARAFRAARAARAAGFDDPARTTTAFLRVRDLARYLLASFLSRRPLSARSRKFWSISFRGPGDPNGSHAMPTLSSGASGTDVGKKPVA